MLAMVQLKCDIASTHKTRASNTYVDLQISHSELVGIEHFHIHGNKNSHKNNHDYSVKLLYKFQCVSYDKKYKTAYLIKV